MPRKKKKRADYGEGSVDQLPSGRWRVRVRTPFGHVSKSFDTEEQAHIFRREIVNARERGEGSIPPAPAEGQTADLTLEEWVERWLAHRKATAAPKTEYHDRTRAAGPIMAMFGERRLSSLKTAELFDWLARLGGSSSERQKVGKVFKRLLKDAVAAKVLAANPLDGLRLAKPERPEKVALTREQAARLVEAAARHRLAAYVPVGLDTGARPGEMVALHWPDFDPVAGTLFVHRTLEEVEGKRRLKETKTPRSRRRLRIAPVAVEALNAHRERMKKEGRDVENGLIFCNATGGFLWFSNFLRWFFRPATERAKIPPVRPYDLRHTCATLLLEAGVPAKVVAERLGHTGIDTLLAYYAHALPDSQERAVQALGSIFGGELCHAGAERRQEQKRRTPQVLN